MKHLFFIIIAAFFAFGCKISEKKILKKLSTIAVCKEDSLIKFLKNYENDSTLVITMYYNDTAQSYCKITEYKEYRYISTENANIDLSVYNSWHYRVPMYVLQINDDFKFLGVNRKDNNTIKFSLSPKKTYNLYVGGAGYYNVVLEDIILLGGLYTINVYLCPIPMGK